MSLSTGALPETCTLREFASIAGFKPSYITRLKADDRLVLTEDGKRVRVVESLQRIKDTADPTRIGVVRRHAEHRQAQGSGEVPPASDELHGSDEPDEATSTYQHWRERGERAKALAAERENDIADRKLLRADELEPAIADAFTLIRARIEALPEVLGDELAVMTDPQAVRARMREEIEQLLTETSNKLEALSKAA
jgi:hypothetical protein